jgi:hypothetical protein
VEPVIIVLDSDDGAMWFDIESPNTVADMSDVLYVSEDGALRVDFEEGSPDPWLIVAHLPLEAGSGALLGDRLETGDPLLDSIDDYGGGFPVLIDGVRWGCLWALSGEPRFWGPCEPPYDVGGPVRLQTRRLIAHWSEVEEDARISGWFGWWVSEVDDERVCFSADMDEDGMTFKVQLRAGRTDQELVKEFEVFVNRFCDSPYIEAGLITALKNGGFWEGYASELDPDASDTCKCVGTVSII